jgi:hypothetical protein
VWSGGLTPAGPTLRPICDQRRYGIGPIAMYRVGVNQQTHEEIAAAAGAHRELGSGYDDAVAEGLVERIGAEVDKRVDARLSQHGLSARRLARPSPSGTFFGLTSMVIGGITAVSIMNSNNAAAAYVAVLIWIVIGVINVGYAWARRR